MFTKGEGMKINKNRYEKMEYRRLGNSGIKLPVMTLGLWHNFGANDDYENCKTVKINPSLFICSIIFVLW